MPVPEWRVLIADDEPSARRGVRQLLVPHSSFTIVAEARDGPEALDLIARYLPHVVFLDIQMQGCDGFDVIARRPLQIMPAFVFLTAYEQHALRGFEVEAFDYLVKPVTSPRFAKTIERLSRALATGPDAPRVEPALVVTTTRGSVRIELHEIDWIESADNYARIWIGKRGLLLRESLQRLEERLVTQGFCRVHRCALVRIAAIRGLMRSPAGGLVAVLRSGATIDVSRRQRGELVQRMRDTDVVSSPIKGNATRRDM